LCLPNKTWQSQWGNFKGLPIQGITCPVENNLIIFKNDPLKSAKVEIAQQFAVYFYMQKKAVH